MTADQPVVLIGLDGADFNEIEPWLRNGSLPHLQSLRETGTVAELESTIPPWTPVAWPSLATGRNPGKHGIFDFFIFGGREKTLINRLDVDSPYFWEVCNAHDMTPVVVNYPVTHPSADLENGAIVPGYLAPEDIAFHPSGLRDEYESEHGPYRIYPDYESETAEEYITVAQCRRDMVQFLDKRYDWDCLVVQFQVTDSVFHALDDRNEIRKVFETVDEYVGDIVALAPDDAAVFVVSDHGMGDYDGVFYVNSWLEQRGYCETKSGTPTYFQDEKKQLRSESSDTADENKVAEMLIRAASSVGLTPQRIYSALSDLGLATAVVDLLPTSVVGSAASRTVNWSKSDAFQFYFNSWGLHINRTDWNPEGTVQPEEVPTLRRELISELQRVRTPDGDPLFESVVSATDVYSGNHVEDAPDILMVPTNCQYDISGTVLDTFRQWTHKNHKQHGIFIASGASLEVEGELSIYDIAPTVGALLGLPFDAETDGTSRVATGNQTAETTETAVVDWQSVAPDAVPQADESLGGSVEDQLEQLGYLS